MLVCTFASLLTYLTQTIDFLRLHIRLYLDKQLQIPKVDQSEFIVIKIRIATFSKNNDMAVVNISGTLCGFCLERFPLPLCAWDGLR